MTALENYADQRITITGILEKFTEKFDKKIALVQECMVEEGEQRIDIGHQWVQFAQQIERSGASRGDKLKFTARVRPYVKKRESDSGVYLTTRDYGLSYPDNVQILGNDSKPIDEISKQQVANEFIAMAEPIRTHRKVTEQERQQIFALRDDGYSLNEISAMVNRPYNTVWRTLNPLQETAAPAAPKPVPAPVAPKVEPAPVQAAAEPPAPPKPEPQGSATGAVVSFIRDVKELARKCGGIDELKKLVEALAD